MMRQVLWLFHLRMILFSCLCLFVSSTSILSQSFAGQHDGYRLSAVQVSWIPDKDYEELGRTLDVARGSGANTVIFRVFQNPGDRVYGFAQPATNAGVYFKTSRAPVVDDLLQRVAEMVHRRGLRIFAWMTTRAAGFDMEKAPRFRCRRYDFRKGYVEDAPGLTIFHPDVTNHLLALYTDLSRYPIDGILLQDDLILRHNEDFSEAASNAYRQSTGSNLDPLRMYQEIRVAADGRPHVGSYTPEFWKWAQWKARWIVRLVREIVLSARQEKPALPVALNFMYEAAAFPEKALCWLSQSLPDAASEGFDYYAIMAYHQQMERELRKSPEEIRAIISSMARSAISLVRRPEQILMKLQTVVWETGEPIPSHDLFNVRRAALAAGPVSMALVPYGAHLEPATLAGMLDLSK